MPKLQPAAMQLMFYTGKRSGDSADWIDISQAASIVNRRFYRQGLQWAVSGLTVSFDQTGQATGEFRVETLPTTWVMSNAWHKSFAAWKRQQDIALDDSDQESVAAKFRDFKIFMDTAHVEDYTDLAGSANLNAVNLLPRTEVAEFEAGTPSGESKGEWQPSVIVLPNQSNPTGSEVGTQAESKLLHAVGAVGTGSPDTSRGIIAGYAFSRSVPQSPDPTVDPRVDDEEYNWLRNMFDDGNADETILANTQRNDELPYTQLQYPNTGLNGNGLQVVHKRFIPNSGVTNTLNLGAFVAPCGLIKVTNTTGVTGNIILHLTPGKHRGYLAEPMQDM